MSQCNKAEKRFLCDSDSEAEDEPEHVSVILGATCHRKEGKEDLQTVVHVLFL